MPTPITTDGKLKMNKKKTKDTSKAALVPTFPHIDNDQFQLLPLKLPYKPSHYDDDDDDDIAQSYEAFNHDTTPDDRLHRHGSPHTFSNRTLCAAVQNNCSIDAIKWYIQSYQTNSRSKKLLITEGWPALYYAAERNSGELVKLLSKAGVNAAKIGSIFSIPLVAYVVVHGHVKAIDTSAVLKTLLAAGYDPTVIPVDMWLNFLEIPRTAVDSSIELTDAARHASAWCSSRVRRLLARSLHLTHRYLLRLAHGLAITRGRKAQIAEANNMTELTRLPYFLIGQRPAVRVVMERVYSHVSLDDQTPLVMAFSGASGHGKTELATAMGDLLSVKSTIIDMASCRNVWGLLGPTAGFSGSPEGSKLNNFLAANNGKRSVVFLDEFDKTEQGVREALLLLTQNGQYEDRRNNTAVDCRKTIWIVATNFGDDTISQYYDKHLKDLHEQRRNAANIRVLQASLRHAYRTKFGAAFTGRINLVVPFLPFTEPECAVMVHKFMLQFATNIRQSINLQPDVHRLVGHCRLSLIDDGNICLNLTKTFYDPELGARSLANGVKEVEYEFSTEYGNTDELATEDINAGPLQHFVVRRIPVSDDEYEVGVFRHDSAESVMQEPGDDNEWKDANDSAEVDEELGTWPSS